MSLDALPDMLFLLMSTSITWVNKNWTVHALNDVTICIVQFLTHYVLVC